MSGKTVKEVENLVANQVQDYVLRVHEKDNKTEQIDGADIQFEYVSDGAAQQLKYSQNSFLWINAYFHPQEYTMTTPTVYNKAKLKEAMEKLDAFDSDKVTEPKDAYIDETSSGFEIVEEVEGNQLDEDKVYELLCQAVTDGTLLDTEKYYIMFWPKALEHFGYQVTREKVLTLRSLGRPYAPEHLKKMVGDPNLDYQAVRSYRSKIMEEYLKTVKVDIKPGAVEILTYLKDKNIHRAVATASDLERTTRYLKQFGLYEYFDKIVCAPMVEHGKPAPDVYEYACSQIGLAPEECMAVEDSPNGIKSACAAGCKVVMVPDLTQPDEEIKDMLYACVPTLTDLKQFI